MGTTDSNVNQRSEFLDALLNYAPVGIVLIDNLGVIKLCNHQFLKYFKIKAPLIDVINCNVTKILANYHQLKDVLSINIKHETKTQKTEIIIVPDRYCTLNWQTLERGYIITIEDITRQKQLENNSIRSILESQENERRRIGREIHDGIGPMLSFMKINLDAFIEQSKSNSSDFNILSTIQDSIDTITNDLRAISHSLAPRLLDEFGLRPAFENLVVMLNRSKKNNISLYSNIEKDQRFDYEVELNLFRCAQELLNNSVKYSKAQNIIVQIILHENSIVVTIEDDGIGFDYGLTRKTNAGIGLENVNTRIRMLNGDFVLDSAIGRGTVASIEVKI